tara:strand:- start:360 stop:503 length:144 start_codon:yes stop_codon:yes gene_type:complete
MVLTRGAKLSDSIMMYSKAVFAKRLSTAGVVPESGVGAGVGVGISSR